MSKPPRQLIQNPKKKTMKRLRNCNRKQSSLLKNCHLNKNHSVLKKEIVCLKRSNSSLKLQLHEQKLEYAALDRKYLHLEAEVHQLQLTNSALKEENRHYEKLVANTEPEIRSCMTQLLETSQTLAGLQMAYNRNRSQQQLSKISGSLSRTQSRFHSTTSKSSLKFNKNVLNVAPRRKQAVRPMVQGLQIFTNLTIPLQRVSLPNQNSRSRIQVPVVEAPQESEAVNIAVEPERSSSVLFEKHRGNRHFVKNKKSKPKHFGVKKDDSRLSKNDFKHSGSVCMVPEINFDDSSESEPEVKKRYLKPIVLIRDFNVPSSKGGKRSSLDRNFTIKTSSSKTAVTNELDVNFQDPLEGTSKMFLNSSCVSNKSDVRGKAAACVSDQNPSCVPDSDSDHRNQEMTIPSSNRNLTGSCLAKTGSRLSVVALSSCSTSTNEEQGTSCQAGSTNSGRTAENTIEMNLTGRVVREEIVRFESVNVESESSGENQDNIEVNPVTFDV